jgi:hypothetical protein
VGGGAGPGGGRCCKSWRNQHVCRRREDVRSSSPGGDEEQADIEDFLFFS